MTDLIDKLNQLEEIQSVSDNGNGSIEVHMNGVNVSIRENNSVYEMVTFTDVIELGDEEEVVSFFRDY